MSLLGTFESRRLAPLSPSVPVPEHQPYEGQEGQYDGSGYTHPPVKKWTVNHAQKARNARRRIL